jgi:hypothetical protein
LVAVFDGLSGSNNGEHHGRSCSVGRV